MLELFWGNFPKNVITPEVKETFGWPLWDKSLLCLLLLQKVHFYSGNFYAYYISEGKNNNATNKFYKKKLRELVCWEKQSCWFIRRNKWGYPLLDENIHIQLHKYKYIGAYHCRLVTFQAGDAVQKVHFIFWNFILIFAFFCTFHRIPHHFRYFSNLTLDFFKYILGRSPQTDTELRVRAGVRN